MVTMAETEITPPDSTLADAVLVTDMAGLITVVVALDVAVTGAPIWPVPDAVTVSVTVPGVPGAAYEPVQVVFAPAASVVVPQVSAPAWSSTAVTPVSVAVPVLVTTALTDIVPLTSTFAVAALDTEI